MEKSKNSRVFYFKSQVGQLLLLLLFTISSITDVISQDKQISKSKFTPNQIWEEGLPYIKNYTSDDYKSSPQNWGFTEGSNGFIYTGNTSGILQFDGSTWDSYKLKNGSLVRSLAQGEKEKIYYGGVHELGYLQPNDIGEMQVHSLVENIPQEYQNFEDVWTTLVFNGNTYFTSDKYLFRWNGEKFKIWESKEKFGFAFNINNTLYIESKGVGIHKINGESLELISNGDILKNNTSKIDVMLPNDANNILFATASDGLLLFNGNNLIPFNKESNEVFSKHRIYKAFTLSNGDYAFATTTSGLYIVDKNDGVIKKRLGKKEGLISDVLFSIFQDSSGAIWVGSDNGLSRIDWSSPFRSFNSFNGLNERVRSVSYHNNKFLVDSKGLHQLVLAGNNNEPHFKKIDGFKRSIKYIVPYNNELLAFDSEHIYTLDGKGKAHLLKLQDWALTSLVLSQVDPTKMYAGTLQGKLFECTFLNKKWSVKPILEIDGGIEGIVEEKNGNLWLQTYFKGLYHAKLKHEESVTEFYLKKYDTLSGLPTLTYNFPYQFNDKTFVTTQEGMYFFNKENQSFEMDSLLTKQYHSSVDAFGFMGLDKRGAIWQTVRAGFENKIYKLSENQLIELNEYKIFKDFSTYSMEFLEDIVLFTGPKGVLLYNQNKERTYKKNLSTKLRKIWINNDSLIYAGTNLNKNKEIEIPFKNNNLKFEYALPFFVKSETNSYQTILEGFDNEWSAWTSQTKKDYTNLPEGNFTFRVRSKNIFDKIGNEDTYSFTVLPPWHRSWWAYLIYGLGAIALVSLLINWRSKELQRQNENLENLVAARTTEIRHKNELLNHQTEQLVELNESKTKLYSNITHEFRTPLTVILGMAETLRTNVQNQSFEGANTSLEMIRRNGKNLLQLVNELLDLAKVESGAMELNLVQTDAIPFVKYLSESFHSLAESKKINLTVYSEIDTLEMDIDVNKMASIIANLLSNAIKYTLENGKIIVHLNKITTGDKDLFSIKVQDNGVGLAEEDINHLFDRFYQVDNESSPKQPGTGIGLSLVKEFAELMNGTIAVESTLEKGSTFKVLIPITNKAAKTVDAKITVESTTKAITPTLKKELSPIKEKESNLPLVLIIEDNEDVAHYLKTCLKDKYKTLHALNGNVGIQMAYENIPDIIISDVMMPGKDGFEVCATLKSDERTDHIPIILLTAKVTTQDRLTGLTHGADAYLAKPFIKEELFTRLDQLILVRKKLIGKLEKNGLASLLKEKVENPQTKFLKEAIKVIHNNLDDGQFGPTQLAKELHFSESQIYRKLKSITDKSTAIFIRSVRLQKAKELIQTTQKTISEIAYEVGFNDPSWFSRAFKEEFGFPPSDIYK
ncbi:ATP-binding protein [Maribacter sp. TH_r10]|uniref:hybrid sensor histidine kinase/response regulator transcription factor n=1 Tax=Maribacter sp. TH_r10 TaxID=3082086 RepID=UPI002952FA33|nr:ATP-binding protein [Maribacter sp. TH_r10]MDV7139373.1 ATP-binding protein [Maribacter sp. TH_r10]